MYLILGLVVGFFGAFEFGITGGLFGGLIGILGAEVLALRKRLEILEKIKEEKSDKPKEVVDDIIFFELSDRKPAASAGKPRQEYTGPQAHLPIREAIGEKAEIKQNSVLDKFFCSLGGNAENFANRIIHFFTSGNLVLKIGIIVIFFGVAFLLKYAAQQNMIPIEFRMVGVAFSGMAMLGCGWWLRRTRSGYGLALQGGGVGILYLVVFAAAKLYSFLPITLSLVVMISLVALSCLLAVLQDSKSLAIFGIVGGFLAPVLMSTGGGSHVLLFSYYALLNAGILGIAWFKSWRELNLIGFVFTFAIGSLWGGMGYQPEFFRSTEFFLILFFVFYVIISILFAYHQPVNLRGFIDGPLVFGLPLIVSGLQYLLVRNFQYGMAFSALALGVFYLTMATILWRRFVSSMHLLCEAFLALGVVFGSLAIPLALDGHWSSSIWALEGAGMVWIGVRQKRVLARHFGLLLQLSAGFIFLNSVWYPFVATAFANQYFLGCLLLSFAALLSSYILDRYHGELKNWERYYPMPLMIVGLIWWYIGGLREVNMQMAYLQKANGFLLFCSMSSILVGMAVKRIQWPRFELALYLQLPAMLLLLPLCLDGFRFNSLFFNSWGIVAWTVAFVTQYRILYLYAEDWPKRNMVAWHLGTMWLLIFVLTHETSGVVGRISGLNETWTTICSALIPSSAMLLLLHLGKGVSWPVGKHASSYLGTGSLLPAFGLLIWTIVSFSIAGDPFPLPYLPIFNPVELSGLVVLITLILWSFNLKNIGYIPKYLSEKHFIWGLAAFIFLWLNSIVARSVHFFAGVSYDPESLYRSVIFQAALAVLWGGGALVITIWAARKANRSIWKVGAALLGMVVVKLFIVDLSGTGTIARIVSFLVVGILMLIIGYFSPLPPKSKENSL